MSSPLIIIVVDPVSIQNAHNFKFYDAAKFGNVNELKRLRAVEGKAKVDVNFKNEKQVSEIQRNERIVLSFSFAFKFRMDGLPCMLQHSIITEMQCII